MLSAPIAMSFVLRIWTWSMDPLPRAPLRGLFNLRKGLTSQILEGIMKDQNFTASFTVDKTPEEAFKAIRNINAWWSEEIVGRTEKVGDVFEYHYKDIHRCNMKMTESVPGKRVAWLVTDNHFNFVDDKTE